MTLTEREAFLLTVGTRKLFMKSFSRFHELSEVELGGAIWTHEFADDGVWEALTKKVGVEYSNLFKEINYV